MNGKTEILLVEDNPNDLKLTLHALQRHEVTSSIAVARDGQEALDYLFAEGKYAGRKGEAPPRLVLLDLKLPGVDGLEVLRTVKSNARTQSIPVVVMTSSNEERDVVESYRLGANAYIQKPVDFDEFIKVVERLGMFWLAVNQPPPVIS